MSSSGNQLIVKNTIFLYIRMLFVLFVSLYTTRALMKIIGVEDYGIYNVVGGFVSMFAFLNTSMANGIQRFYSFERGQGSNEIPAVFTSALIIQVVLGIIVLIVLESFGLWYINNVMVIPVERLNAAKMVFHFSTFSLLVVIIQIPYSAAIIAYEHLDFYAIVTIIDTILKLVAVIFLRYISYDKLVIYGLIILLINLFAFIFYYVFCRIKIDDLKIESSINKGRIVKMVSFTGYNAFDSFAYMLKNQGLNLLLNAFFGPVVNAARGVANQIYSAIQGFQSNVVLAFRPQLIHSYAESNYSRVSALFFSLSKISYVLLFTLSLPICIELDFILDIWLNGIVPDYTKVFTLLVIANLLISSFNTPMTQVVHATGELKWYQIIRSLLIILILPFSYVALKMGGDPSCVFWVSLLFSIINQPVSMVLLHKVYGYEYWDYTHSILLPSLLFSIVSFIPPYLTHLIVPGEWERFFVVVFTSVFSCILFSILLVFSKEERKQIHKLFFSLLRIKGHE